MSKKYIMFVDETGTTSDRRSPFTVTGVIFEYKYAYQPDHAAQACELKSKLDSLKSQCFGRTDLVLHMRDLLNAQKAFSAKNGISNDQLQKFWDLLPSFLQELEFTIISVTVDREKLNDFYATPKDPYTVAFSHIMKSLYAFLSQPIVESVRIVLESRGERGDFQIQKAFFDIFNTGTVHLDVEPYKNKILSFTFSDKHHVHYQYGCEIADVVCLPLSRARRGLVEVKPKHVTYGNRNKIFTAIKGKLFSANANQDVRNWGFKKVPIIKKHRLWHDDTNTPENK